MNPDLERWLEIAARDLSEESLPGIRAEVEARYSGALESHRDGGRPDNEAHLLAMSDLGHPKRANRRFRRSYLTAKEAKHLASMLRPPQRRYFLFALMAASLSVVGLTLMYRRPAVMLLIPLISIYVWAGGLVRDRLRSRLTVRGGIVFAVFAMVTAMALFYLAVGLLVPATFGPGAPGIVGGLCGFALFTWKTYSPLWRKAGARRIAA